MKSKSPSGASIETERVFFMKKKLLALILCGVLAVTAASPVFAAASGGDLLTSASEEETAPADSVLYYGTVREVLRGEDGQITGLLMESERYGEYLFNVSPETVWIDDGKRAADVRGLQAGEGMYVFHSPAETRSLPPQSAAFAIVRNTPMDVGCAQYCEVEAVTESDGRTYIRTSNGALYIVANGETEFSRYNSDEEASASDLRPGSHIIAWNGVNATSYPAQTNALHIMLLPAASWEVLSRAALAEMLYEAEGSPSVSFSLQFADVSENAGYADAVRWADRKNLMPWTGSDLFAPGETVTREQLVTALWRWQGTPSSRTSVLRETQDAGEISASARRAMAWAYTEGLISGTYLGPQDPVTVGEAQEMLAKLTAAD